MCCVPQMENGRSAKVPFVEAVPDVKPPPPTNCLCTTYYCVGKCLFRQSAKSEICVLCVSLSLLSLLLLLLYLFSFSILSVVVVQLAYTSHHTTDQIRLYQKQHMEKQTDQSHTNNTQTQGQSLSPQ